MSNPLPSPSPPRYDIDRITRTTDTLRVKLAATVVCARLRRPSASAAAAAGPVPPPVLRLSDLCPGALASDGPRADNRVQRLFGSAVSNGDKDPVRAFTNGWELLMGQREVQNYLRSGKNDPKLMRYGGDFTFAGGSVDPGETLEACARRELREEFLGIDDFLRIDNNGNGTNGDLSASSSSSSSSAPTYPRLRLLSVHQTRPVMNTSYIMHNFVCLEDENPWLAALDDPAPINAELAARRARFREMGDAFWALDGRAREASGACPEVREVRWLDMRTAVAQAFTSMNGTLTCVNDFQRREFARLGRTHRDPLFITMSVMLGLDQYPDADAVRAATRGVDAAAERARVQWLEDGMSVAEVDSVMDRRAADRAAASGAAAAPGGTAKI